MNAATARVLVVDDERLIRWSMSEHLTRTGHEVRSAESGEEALAKIGSGPPDLMFLDVRLPGMDGLTVLDRALALHPELTVVMISAHSTVDIAVEAMKRGAIDFLVKPVLFKTLDAAIARAASTVKMRQQLELRSAERQGALGSIVGSSPEMVRVRTLVARLAGSEAATVLVEGESGTGKEVVARAIHAESARAQKPFSHVNCAALPERLLESELFGHERGAFTHAHMLKRGVFESAGGGTVFLDEIGDLPAGGQAKLLQLLESRTFRRVGGTVELHSDARIIAATNVGLEKRVTDGLFRADLFFRLNVVRVQLTPLRDHAADIPSLVAHFVQRFNAETNRSVRGVTPRAMEQLMAHRWAGNVRELRNLVERAFALYPAATELGPDELVLAPVATVPALPAPSDGLTELEAVERDLIVQSLAATAGNQSQAARRLGVSRDVFRYRLRKYGLSG